MAYKDPEQKREYDREYKKRNKERLKIYYKEYNLKHQDQRRQSYQESMKDPERRERKRARDRKNNRRRRQELRDNVFEALGGPVCVRCGFDDRRALQIDHINGGGTQEFKKFRHATAYYKHIIEVGNKEYQVLCANCNQIKKCENREYPNLVDD